MKLMRVVGVLVATLAASPSSAQQPTSSTNWPSDPTAFVHLLMGDDLSLRPSAAGQTSVPVADSVRQRVIGARVAWTVARRANPFPSGPRTLPTAAIRQGNQITGVVLLMPRRVAGDSEVCEAPYQQAAIDSPVEISGKIASFQAGVRPDGNIVVVVEVTDVSGCQANGGTGPGAAAGARAALRPDFTGTWRTGGDFRMGTIVLTRTPIIDADGSQGYSGVLQYPDGKPSSREFLYVLKDGAVVFCGAGGEEITAAKAGRCFPNICQLSKTDDTQYSGQCASGILPAFNMTLTKER